MMEWVLPLFVGTVTGILSAFGVGGGSLLLIYLTAFAGFSQHEAQAINLLYFLPVAGAALPSHVKNGFVALRTAALAIATGLLCSAGAAVLSNRLDVSLLRKLFGCFLLLIAFWELFGKRGKKGSGKGAAKEGLR